MRASGRASTESSASAEDSIAATHSCKSEVAWILLSLAKPCTNFINPTRDGSNRERGLFWGAGSTSAGSLAKPPLVLYEGFVV
eukprot:591566-Amphidinium_carterae.1